MAAEAVDKGPPRDHLCARNDDTYPVFDQSRNVNIIRSDDPRSLSG
jgi:hypothetical protein